MFVKWETTPNCPMNYYHFFLNKTKFKIFLTGDCSSIAYNDSWLPIAYNYSWNDLK